MGYDEFHQAGNKQQKADRKLGYHISPSADVTQKLMEPQMCQHYWRGKHLFLNQESDINRYAL